jgi:hypothetical protein
VLKPHFQEEECINVDVLISDLRVFEQENTMD